MLQIDGSTGEGGGQILRTSLSLSMVTGIPFRITNIRSGRKKPGLLRQHLTAVNAAGEISNARIQGAEIGSQKLEFSPAEISPGKYSFSVGTAGSATLVFQTVAPALLTAKEKSTLSFEGGTHNHWAPPFNFLAKTFIPLVNRMGPSITLRLKRFGFYPAGGGSFEADITPSEKLRPLHLMEKGKVTKITGAAYVARLSLDIAKREIRVLKNKLALGEDCLRVEEVDSKGPGNVVTVEVENECLTETFTGFGQIGVRAEKVAGLVAEEVQHYLTIDAPVGKFLADQILLPLSLTGSGSFRTFQPTPHTLTNKGVIEKFLDVKIEMQKESDLVWAVRIGSK